MVNGKWKTVIRYGGQFSNSRRECIGFFPDFFTFFNNQTKDKIQKIYKGYIVKYKYCLKVLQHVF